MSDTEIKRALATHGRRRQKAKDAATAELDAIRLLAPKAIAAGVPKLEIAKLAQISRVTLDDLLPEPSPVNPAKAVKGP